MSVRIDILEGLDKGTHYMVHGPDTRIGTAIEHGVCVSDPAWPVGSIRILRKLGGYQIINDTQSAVLLDRKPLLTGTAHTLHHDAILQPSAKMLLRLRIQADSARTDGVDRVAVPPKKSQNFTNWILIVVLIGLAAWLMLAPKSHGYSATVQNEAELLKVSLRDANIPADKMTQARWQTLRNNFRDAVYEDALQHPGKAYARYLGLRDELSVLQSNTSFDPDTRQTLSQAHDFVVRRLTSTKPPKQRAKSLFGS